MSNSEHVGRRAFLRTLAAGATSTAAARALLPGDARADTETNDEKRKPRYKADSAHIQAYYRVNRYPSK